MPDQPLGFVDRAAGRFSQHLKHDVGDFVIRRADGLWAYQLAVVVDDAEQGITDVVRGADLLDNTPRQIFLQRALGLATPRYLHVPLVLSATGEKLSKQTGADRSSTDARLSSNVPRCTPACVDRAHNRSNDSMQPAIERGASS